ncbi:apolipoprotein A1/A4/E family protein [Falsiroseomonas selenitidurans]|uniref:Apolipoprotein A1/A4/E family protein n=1 Tax=Falsiroseomonas selenitidurans TaxID=2716335 RepID=A0ABX1E1L7_9PROT|nr:apolipoprotein A1/A4/E family protein [Falsiroseomonas selenitidurans]NKC31052.1 apolipoprotein A1/A4/E family protein [Falsiroseomonas selenitidurans]
MSDTRRPGDAGHDPKETAREATGQLRREAAGAAADVKQEAAEVGEAAKRRAGGYVDSQKEAGAERAEDAAGAVHGAADRLGEASPQLARYVHEAAEALEDFGRTLRDSSPAELLGRVEDLARRQPVAFFGAAVLAGFTLVRFARSSAADPRHHGASSPGAGHAGGMTPADGLDPVAEPGEPRGASAAPGWRPATDGGPPRPTTLAAASLGGAAARQGAGAPSSPPPAAGG